MNPVVIVALAPVHPSEFAIYATKAVLIFLFVLVAFRLLGKRHAGSFNVYDVATLMAASNAVQNAMTGGRGNLPVGLIVSSAIVGTAWLLNRTLARNPRLQPPVLGSPTILITHGHILEARLKRQHITHAELSAALRAHSINQIDRWRSPSWNATAPSASCPNPTDRPETQRLRHAVRRRQDMSYRERCMVLGPPLVDNMAARRTAPITVPSGSC